MDGFSKLSITEELEEPEEQNELAGLLDLRISDDYTQNSYNRITNRFMKYLPEVSSPLRNDNNLHMDEKNKLFSSELDIDVDVDMDMDTNEDDHITETPKRKESHVLKNLLSPTQLGIQAAKLNTNTNESMELEKLSQIDTIKNNLKQKQNDKPIHVSINNHNNFYYNNDNYTSDENLPQPWSSDSIPSSKFSYNLISYLQVFSNSLTVSIIIIFFISIIKSDLNSIWYKGQNELIKESENCYKNYNINNCQSNFNLPALTKNCQDWLHCMNRDNKKLFGNKSILMMNLFGQLINSLIQPIGWKAITLILLSLVIWLFTTNFLMGFFRAKYYYNDHKSISPDKNNDNVQQLSVVPR